MGTAARLLRVIGAAGALLALGCGGEGQVTFGTSGHASGSGGSQSGSGGRAGHGGGGAGGYGYVLIT